MKETSSQRRGTSRNINFQNEMMTKLEGEEEDDRMNQNMSSSSDVASGKTTSFQVKENQRREKELNSHSRSRFSLLSLKCLSS
jgi:hypothetical protein